MIKVISIGTDRKVFEAGSAVRARLLKQRELFSELHVIVFSLRRAGLRVEQLGNLWLYPTNSLSKFLYIHDAALLARALISQRDMTGRDSVVTAQDPFECGVAAWYGLKKFPGIPLHLQIHTDFLSPEFKVFSPINRARVFLARWLLPKAAGIRVVSERIARSVRESGLLLKASPEILPVFSDAALKWTAKPLRRFKPNRVGACLAIMASRLAPEKDFLTALKALALARGNGATVGLVIIGEGSEKNKIIGEIEARNLGAIATLELWQSDLSSFFRVSDIVLLTSRFEGYGLVLLEAAVHGRPIVTTDVGIARELVVPPYDRFVCPVGDAECVAARLEELSRDPKLRRAYGSVLRAAAERLVIPEEEYWTRYRALLEQCAK